MAFKDFWERSVQFRAELPKIPGVQLSQSRVTSSSMNGVKRELKSIFKNENKVICTQDFLETKAGLSIKREKILDYYEDVSEVVLL